MKYHITLVQIPPSVGGFTSSLAFCTLSWTIFADSGLISHRHRGQSIILTLWLMAVAAGSQNKTGKVWAEYFFHATQEDLNTLRVSCSERWGTTLCRTLSSTTPWKPSWPLSKHPAKAWAPPHACTCHVVSSHWSVIGQKWCCRIEHTKNRAEDFWLRMCLQVFVWSRNSWRLWKSNITFDPKPCWERI